MGHELSNLISEFNKIYVSYIFEFTFLFFNLSSKSMIIMNQMRIKRKSGEAEESDGGRRNIE